MKAKLPTIEQIDDIVDNVFPAVGSLRDLYQSHYLRGRFVLWDVDENGYWQNPVAANNTALYTWGYVAAQSIGQGNPLYKVNTMYIEYFNVAGPTDTVPVPTFDRSGGLSYYNALSSGHDFLRVPLLASPSISIVPGYETYFNADNGEGNRLTFYAQTSGTTGVLGTAFSDSANSKVFGVALSAAPGDTDRTKDVLFSRGYLPLINQKLKLAGSQIGLTWSFDFL